MSEMSKVAAIDFGTHTSGVVWGRSDDSIVNDFHYSNKALSGGYAKTRTAFLVSSSLLEKIDNLSDNDIVPSSDGREQENINIWVGDIAQEKYLNIVRDINSQENAWVYFDRFKMSLYDKNSVVVGSDGREYSLEKIITLFLRCLKILFFKKDLNFGQTFERDTVKWGVTIPTIWDEHEKSVMKAAASKAFNQEPIFILEPEGAAISFSLQQHGDIDPAYIERDECFLVIDCGGGTTDIVALKLTIENQLAKYEELTEAKGRAAAGRDIDDKFWELLAEKIAKKVQTFGTPYIEYIESVKKRNLAVWHQLEQEWLKIKHTPILEEDIRFELPPSYAHYMIRKYPEFEKNIGDDFGYFIRFSKEEIEEKVFKPVVDEIIKVAQESAQKVSNLDYIFLAGGLSGLSYLQNAVKKGFSQSHPNSRVLFEARSDHANALPGGSIMRGAAVILVFDKLIRRVAKRNYYYVAEIPANDNAMRVIRKQAGGEWTDIQEAAFNAEKQRITPDYGKNQYGEKTVSAFNPICLKGLPATLYKTVLIPVFEYQSNICIRFFSSDRDVFFYRKNDPHIREEREITIPCTSDSEFTIEIDFNEFQQADLYANITNTKTSECTKVALTVEVQVGH